MKNSERNTPKELRPLSAEEKPQWCYLVECINEEMNEQKRHMKDFHCNFLTLLICISCLLTQNFVGTHGKYKPK